MRSRPSRLAVAAGLFLLPTGGSVDAGEASGSLGGVVDYRVLAPDAVWRGERLNVLVVLRAGKGVQTTPVTLRVALPERGFRRPPGFEETRVVQVEAGATQRVAFTGVEADVETPTGRYSTSLSLETAGDVARVDLDVVTLRGAAVPAGLWSILVPVAMALLAIPPFLILLRRNAVAGFWRRTAAAETVPPGDPWWKTNG